MLPKIRKRIRSEETGFSLIELLVVGMDEDALRAVDPSLNDAGGFTVSGVSATGYTLKVDSESTGTFTIAKAGSTVTRTCGPAARENSGGCKNSSW